MSRCPSGVENTCPLIDEVISFLEDLELLDSDDARMRDYMSENMEKIRLMNSSLREWGVGQYEDKNDLESDIKLKDNKINELQYELDNANGTITGLNSEVSRLESEVSDLTVQLEDLQNGYSE